MIFITGANGFVGKTLLQELSKRQMPFKPGTRELYGDMAQVQDWKPFLRGCDCVVHLAARVHVMDEKESNPLLAFRKTNVEATIKMAHAAKEVGVKKFIFISSIKVNGEITGENPFDAKDLPNPQDPYGVSKMEAEIGLLSLHQPDVFDVTIIRPPLVYGPGVRANFEKLFWLVNKDLPLPFKAVKNKRSLVSVFNLCDLIITCLNNSRAAGEVFLVSDGIDYSLRDLIELMGKTSGKYPHLLYVPVGLMRFGAKILGKGDYAQRLFGNLHVDINKTKNLLGWKPPYTFEMTYGKNS